MMNDERRMAPAENPPAPGELTPLGAPRGLSRRRAVAYFNSPFIVLCSSFIVLRWCIKRE
jgi:hypothetical protein